MKRKIWRIEKSGKLENFQKNCEKSGKENFKGLKG